MGQSLTGQTVQTTYDALIKVGDNTALDGTLKPLSDGLGTNLPVSASTSGMSYSGTQDFTGATVTGITSGTSGTSGVSGTAGTSGTSGTSGNTGTSGTSGISGQNGSAGTSGTSGSSGVSGGGVTEVMFPEQFLKLQGYAPAFGNYFLLSSPVVGQITFQNAIDVNDQKMMMAPLYVQPGVTIPYMWFKVLNITGVDSYEFAIYDTYSNGRPKDRIFYSTFGVDPVNGANQWLPKGINTVNFTEPFYWIAIKPRTGFGLNSNLAVFNRANVVSRLATAAGGNDLYPIAQLQYSNIGLPLSFTDTETFQHRDEGFVVGLSLASGEM